MKYRILTLTIWTKNIGTIDNNGFLCKINSSISMTVYFS